MSSFQDLPDELFLKVFSYAETVDLLRCAQVSKRIRTISNDDSLFQTVNLRDKYVKTDLLAIVLNKGCKQLNLTNSFIWGNLSLIQNSNLMELDLSNCEDYCEGTAYDVLEKLVASSHSLQKLSLAGLLITQKMVDSICQNGETLQAITLHNSYIKLGNREGIMKLKNLCLQNKNLVLVCRNFS